MKKNELTDKNYAKGSKGFYAALGISAVMIGAACLFAHNKGDKIAELNPTADNSRIVQEAAVDRRVTDIPKSTTPAYRVTTEAAATHIFTDAPQITLPAAEITVDAPYDAENSFAPQPEDTEAVAASDNMQNPALPLSDISNIISPFSSGELVKNETTGSWQTHNGADIAAEVGAEVYATANGEVTAVKNDALWGVTVLIDHKNGYTTKYCGLGSDLAVQEGDTVESGKLIGAVGETADIESSAAAHLHIEITHNGAYIDPISVITKS